MDERTSRERRESIRERVAALDEELAREVAGLFSEVDVQHLRDISVTHTWAKDLASRIEKLLPQKLGGTDMSQPG